mgnify:FL=1|tara:strand:+ start:539 stop:700 length:162 start_codon:yes stop_codon:yes gene_type:complete
MNSYEARRVAEVLELARKGRSQAPSSASAYYFKQIATIARFLVDLHDLKKEID